MDRATFLLLAPFGTVALDWAMATDDGDTWSAVAPSGERVEAYSPFALLTMVRARPSKVVYLPRALAA
jgi:uncharacterized protein YqcC (DUF446 family)